MNFCPNCGSPVKPGHRFCGECGAKLTEPLPPEPVYTDDDKLKNNPLWKSAPEPRAPKKAEKVPELTLEPAAETRGAALPSAPARPGGGGRAPELFLMPDTPQRETTKKTPELTLEPVFEAAPAEAEIAAPEAEFAPLEAESEAAEAEIAAPEQPPAPYIPPWEMRKRMSGLAPEPEVAPEEPEELLPPEPEEIGEPAIPAPEEAGALPAAAATAEEPSPFSGFAETYAPEKPASGAQQSPDNVPNDYTMSQGDFKGLPDAASPSQLPEALRMPNGTLLLIWGILLICMFSICGILALAKIIKARSQQDSVLRYKLLSSAKVWLIVGTLLHLIPILARIL